MKRIYANWVPYISGNGITVEKYELQIRIGEELIVTLSEAEAGALVNLILDKLDYDLPDRK